jgi:serine/threonine protein kinase
MSLSHAPRTSEIPALSLDNVVTQSLLGKGSFSKVYRVRIIRRNDVTIEHSPDGNQQDYYGPCSFALKCPRHCRGRGVESNSDKTVSADLMAIANLKFEAEILSDLNHPNIVRIRGVVANEQCPLLGYFFIMDCLHQETLKDRLQHWKGHHLGCHLLDLTQSISKPSSGGISYNTKLARSVSSRINEIAIPIASAMMHIHSKGIVLRDLKVRKRIVCVFRGLVQRSLGRQRCGSKLDLLINNEIV